jgi:hypothetical protein
MPVIAVYEHKPQRFWISSNPLPYELERLAWFREQQKERRVRKHLVEQAATDSGEQRWPWTAAIRLTIGSQVFNRGQTIPDALLKPESCANLQKLIAARAIVRQPPAPPARPRPAPVTVAPPAPKSRKKLREPESVSKCRAALLHVCERHKCDKPTGLDKLIHDPVGNELFLRAQGDWSAFPRQVLSTAWGGGGSRQIQQVGQGSVAVRRPVDDFLAQLFGPEPSDDEQEAA